ncbi:MAG: S1 RNA-binding domain-containing protein [Clostridia bacterium]|jgi:small subunit ribosomal protein S1|nr:S1 RNA-binding domain-containing protein [Clostridia bacterium]
MNAFKFFPEGWKNEDLENTNDIFQGIVEKCDQNYNLYVKTENGLEGIMPRQEVDAVNLDENGLPKTNICTGKVHKYVQYKIKEKNGDNLILSRKDVQKEVIEYIKSDLQVGQTINGIVKNITPYGAFIDIGGGVVGLVHIEDLSVARIKTPYERIKIGQKLKIVVKYIDREAGKINLSYKETLGTWEENIHNFKTGMKVQGIVRETEKNKNGIFIELTPNLVGMAEYKYGLDYGEKVDVVIKKIDYDKKKVKLILN